MVTSRPGRSTRALPNGTRYSPSGTGPVMLCSHRCSMNTTGLSSSTAEISSPFASCGVLGITTLSPGMCANHDWRLCECCGPCPHPRPTSNRTTSGTLFCPPNM